MASPAAEVRLPDGVSVVIPAYNEEGAVVDGLKEIQAVLDELECESEIVVVNDGSSDRTGELAEAAGFRVIHQPEKAGQSARCGAEERGPAGPATAAQLM